MVRRNVRPADVPARLEGRRVTGLDRHGKFLIGDVDGDLRLVLHLGMSGRVRVVKPGDDEAPHTNVVLDLGDHQVHFVDPRTFGFVAVWTEEEFRASTLMRLGPDALTEPIDGPTLARRLQGRIVPIKAALLDQRIIAGLGNIYADEVLARAGVHPRRPSGGLSGDEVAAIAEAIGPVLAAGIAAGGTSLSDLAYLLPDGRAGGSIAELAVYGREGEPCGRCGGPIGRTVVAQRSSHFCPVCQPLEVER